MASYYTIKSSPSLKPKTHHPQDDPSAALHALWYNSQAKEASLFEIDIRYKTKSSHEGG
jgi:hypothetical protein